jgi:hypothetical protein
VSLKLLATHPLELDLSNNSLTKGALRRWDQVSGLLIDSIDSLGQVSGLLIDAIDSLGQVSGLLIDAIDSLGQVSGLQY